MVMRVNHEHLLIETVSSPEEVFQRAARIFMESAATAIAQGKRFRVALSGGTTPAGLYRQLVARSQDTALGWDKIDWYFSDERAVPPEDAESNFRMAEENLFLPLALNRAQIFRIKGELPPDSAAQAYEALIREQFGCPPGGYPAFDFILLGMGEDGHIASLFPDHAALQDTVRLVAPSRSPKGISGRITFTLPTINHAAYVLILVCGSPKASMLREVLTGSGTPALPARLLAPLNGRLHWLIDRDAASQLSLSIKEVP